MESTGNAQDNQAAINGGLRTSVCLGLAWLAVAACFWAGAWMLEALDQSGFFIFLAPGLNSETLASSLAFLATVPLIAGIHRLTKCSLAGVKHRWIARLVKSAGWITGICSAGVLLFWAGIMLLFSPLSSYVLESADDARSVLIVNRTVLHAGGFRVYEQRTWPIYQAVGRVSTNNAYDPFREGTYRQTWTDEGLELEFVFDYMEPNRYVRTVIELR
ncbi:hypothetical protein ACX80E_14560 [Arthrobacter sp. TMN-49]